MGAEQGKGYADALPRLRMRHAAGMVLAAQKKVPCMRMLCNN